MARRRPPADPLDALLLSALAPKASRGSASVKNLDKWAKAQVNTHTTTSSGDGHQAGAGESVLSGLKNIGKTALNTLSVPQAITFVGVSKLMEGIQRATGHDPGHTMSMSDMLGNFSDDYKGAAELFEQGGVDKNSKLAKWGGLVTDVVADPMWALGFAKLPKLAGEVGKAVDVVGDAARTGETVTKAVKGGSKAAEKVEDVVKPVIKRNQSVKVEQGAHPRMPQAPAKTKGVVIDDTWTVIKTSAGTKKKGSKPTYAVYENLDEDAKVIGAAQEPLSPVFRSQKEAIDWVTENAKRGTGQSLEPKFAQAVGPAGSSMLTPATRTNALEGLANFEKGRFSGKGDMGIRLGFGKGNPEGGKGLSKFAGIGNYTIRTKVPLPGRTLGSLNSGKDWLSFIRRDPVDKVAHRLNTAGREQIEHIGNSFVDDAAKLFPGLTEEQRVALWVASASKQLGLSGSKRADAIHGSSGLEDAFDLGDQVVGMMKQSGKWNDEMDRAMNWGRGWLDEHGKLEGVIPDQVRGDYFPLPVSDETRLAQREMKGGGSMFSGRGAPAIIGDKKRTHESLLNYFNNSDEFSDFLQKSAGLDKDTADDVAGFLDDQSRVLAESDYYKNRPGEIRFRDEAGQEALPEWVKPDTDFFSVIGKRDQEHVRRVTENQIERMFIDEGLASRVPVVSEKGAGTGDFKAHPWKTEMSFKDEAAEKAFARIRRRVNTENLQGMLSEHAKTQGYQNFMAHFKGLLTTFNIQHPVANMMGDSWNREVTGNFLPAVSTLFFRAGGPGKGVKKGSEWAKMATRNDEAFKKVYTINGIDYTGAEVYALSHMMGLGKGYVGEDIARFIKMNEVSKNPANKYYRYMQRYNMTREDAVRLQTFFGHLHKGADPMEAQYKTLVGIFDYGDLTDFEKIYLRNLLMFYTWMRKNTALQVKALAMRPGLGATAGDFERDREKMPFEPDYISEMGLVPVPGFGNLNVFGPWADLNKLEPSWEQGRKTLLSATAPPIKQAIELGTNTNLFTGGQIEKYDGALASSNFPVVDRVMNMLGIGEPSRKREGGDLAPAVPSQLAYLLNQLGPVASQSGKLTLDDSPVASGSWIDKFGTLTGFPRRVVENPDWQRQWELRQRKKKADATRKSNATAENPRN